MSIHKKANKTGIVYQVKYRRTNGSQTSRNFKSKKQAEAYESEIRALTFWGDLPDDRSGRIIFKELALRF